jgi:hypothetical protein
MTDTGPGFTRSQERPTPKANGGGADAASSRFAPIWLDDIEIDKEAVYIVEGILPAGPSFGETPAPPKSLKSFFLMDLLMHIAIGKPYGGRKVQQGAVVYITSEGIRGVKRRLVAMRKHHGVGGGRIPFALISAMPNLGAGTDDRNKLIEQIKIAMQTLSPKVPLRAIVIDTMRKAMPGKDENSSKDMSTFLANCEALATAFNCHVNAAHHSPRSDDSRGSGTNAVEGACDVVLPVTRCDVGKTPRATITVGYMKDGEEGDSWTIEIRTKSIGTETNPQIGAYVVIVEPPARRAESTVKKKPEKLSDPNSCLLGGWGRHPRVALPTAAAPAP